MNYIKKIIKEDDNCSINNQADYLLFYAVSVLIITSIIFSYSLSIYKVSSTGFSQFHFFIRQGFVGLLGICIMWFMSKQSPDEVIDYIGTSIFVLFLIILIIMPILPESLVTETGGANRWIKLSIVKIAPVEFFKLGFVYFLARSFNKNLLGRNKYLTATEEIILYIPYIMLLALLIPVIAIAQKDFGQMVLIILTTFIMLAFSNRSFRVFAFLGLLSIMGFVGLIVIEPHRLNRIASWWGMVQDNYLSMFSEGLAAKMRVENISEPWQVGNSLNAINNGGYIGTGIGEGNLKMGYLSEVHTDFVLAGIAEEIGFIGLVFIVFTLLFVILRVIRISRRVDNAKYHLFTLGVALLIAISFLINFGGIIGIIPMKGMAVPFLSYGGSSMLSLCVAIGLVLSISKKIPIKNDKDLIYEK
jgi:cell division protein FtsW